MPFPGVGLASIILLATSFVSDGQVCGRATENAVLTLSCASMGSSSVISSIIFASYGIPGGSCPSLTILNTCHSTASMSVITAACVGRQSCSVTAATSVFGGVDPCSGSTKSLGVTVACSSTAVCAGPVAEGSSLSLSCAAYGANSLISSVLWASFGTATGSCPTGFAASACNAVMSTGIVAAACVGRRSCSVASTTTLFTDPCSGTAKYLVAVATCTATCGSVTENGVLSLSCDAGSSIAAVPFASFGTPTGSCLSRFTSGSCAATTSLALATSACVGWPSCALTATLAAQGGDPCSGTAKTLAAAVTCSNPTCGAVGENVYLTLSCASNGGYITGVSFASYGTPNGSCASGWTVVPACHASTSMAVVTAACVGLQTCAVPSNFKLYGGDPCNGVAKRLAASVTCSASNVICGYAVERATLSLSCAAYGASSVITSIIFASFGQPQGSCPGGFRASSTCNAANTSLAAVNASCLGRSSCSIPVEKTAFGNYDPCYGLGKALAVVASCGNSTGVPYTRGNILALRIDTFDGSALSTSSAARVSIDEFMGGTTSAALRIQSATLPGLCSLSGNAFEGRIATSFTGNVASFSCYFLNSNLAALHAYAQRQIMTVSSNGIFSAAGAAIVTVPSALYAGPSVYAAVQDSSGAYYVGASNTVNGSLVYAPLRGGAVATYTGSAAAVTSVSVFANAVWSCVLGAGIFRASLRAARTPAPVLASTCGGTCVDFVFQTATTLWVCDPTTGVWNYSGSTWLPAFSPSGASPAVPLACVAITGQVEPAPAGPGTFVLYFVSSVTASYPVYRFITSTGVAYQVVASAGGGVFGGLAPVPVATSPFFPGNIVVLRVSNLGMPLNSSAGNQIYLDEYASGTITTTSAQRSLAVPPADACSLTPGVNNGGLSLSASGSTLSFACGSRGRGEATSPHLQSYAAFDWMGTYFQSVSLGSSISSDVAAYGALLVNGSAGPAYMALATGIAYAPSNAAAFALIYSSMSAAQVLLFSGTLYFVSPSGRGIFQLGSQGVPPTSGSPPATIVTPAYAGGTESPASFVVQSSSAVWVCDAGGATGRGVWSITGGSLSSPPLLTSSRVSSSAGAPCISITGQVESCRYWLYYVSGAPSSPNAIVRFLSSQPATSFTIVPSSSSATQFDVFLGIARAPVSNFVTTSQTCSQSQTSSATQSPSITQSSTLSMSSSQTQSPTLTSTSTGTRSASQTQTLSGTVSASGTGSLSSTASASRTGSSTLTASVTQSSSSSQAGTPTQTRSATPTLTPSQTLSQAVSTSASGTLSTSGSGTGSGSRTASSTFSRTQVPTISSTTSASQVPSTTQSLSPTQSQSTSISVTPSARSTRSPTQALSAGVSPSASPSQVASPSLTSSMMQSSSMTGSGTLSGTSTRSSTQAISAGVSPSASPSNMPSMSVTPSMTQAFPTASVTGTRSQHLTVSSSATLAAPLSFSPSASQAASVSQTATSTNTQRGTGSMTPSVGSSISQAVTLTQSSTATVTQTPSSSQSQSVSQQGSRSRSSTASSTQAVSPGISTSSSSSQGVSISSTLASTPSYTPTSSVTGTLSQVSSSATPLPSESQSQSFLRSSSSCTQSGSQLNTVAPSALLPTSSVSAFASSLPSLSDSRAPLASSSQLLTTTASATLAASATGTLSASQSLSTSQNSSVVDSSCVPMSVPISLALSGGIIPEAITIPSVGVLLRLSIACYLGVPLADVTVSRAGNNATTIFVALGDAVNTANASCASLASSSQGRALRDRVSFVTHLEADRSNLRDTASELLGRRLGSAADTVVSVSALVTGCSTASDGSPAVSDLMAARISGISGSVADTPRPSFSNFVAAVASASGIPSTGVAVAATTGIPSRLVAASPTSTATPAASAFPIVPVAAAVGAFVAVCMALVIVYFLWRGRNMNKNERRTAESTSAPNGESTACENPMLVRANARRAAAEAPARRQRHSIKTVFGQRMSHDVDSLDAQASASSERMYPRLGTASTGEHRDAIFSRPRAAGSADITMTSNPMMRGASGTSPSDNRDSAGAGLAPAGSNASSLQRSTAAYAYANKSVVKGTPGRTSRKADRQQTGTEHQLEAV